MENSFRKWMRLVESTDKETTIYVDPMGTPQPKAQIAHFGGVYGRGGYWALCTTAKNLSQQRWDSPEEAEVDMVKNGWRVINRKKDGHNAVLIDIEHPPTADALAHLMTTDDRKWEKAKPCFVRYGKLPEGGRSRNHRDDFLEDGVSVFHGQVLPSGEARAIPAHTHELGTMLSFQSKNVQLYIVKGDVIGSGSDGEPVLTNCKIIRRAKQG